ncbi:SARP family transcriptional regulator [Planobispora takensis]|uniref:SARP family transcriptional regulator n=1 Tax=Planobispora takensis TaxID=1367882 RepID=A0A8J3WRI8_9ACTN|nr:SARP family transcriptional regulator [Planobispora takensis]
MDTETSFTVLGPLEIHRRGEKVEIAGQRLRTLLALLLLDAGRPVPVDRLVAGVWGDRPPVAAGNALQALVSRLRASLGDLRGLVEAVPAGYRLAVAPDLVDAHRFARLAAEGRDALAAGSAAQAAAVLRAALDLWRGPALAGLSADEDVTAAVTRLETLRLAALEDRIEADLLLGRAAEAAAELPALVAAHPLRERLRGQLMRALYGSGRRVEALAAFEEARAAFAEELGADPSPALAGLHLSMLRHEWSEGRVTPQGRTRPGTPGGSSGMTGASERSGSSGGSGSPGERDRPARPGNLRARLTSFVGRERDVARLADLLAEHRLVTLTGPGGAGKTRLAVECADAVAGRMPDGVWMVELAPVAEPSQVPQAVFSALELRDGSPVPPPGALPLQDARDLVSRLVAALKGKRLLIIMDNCEHLVEAAAALADRLLAGCPGVRVLATGREPLAITGELTWPVPPLELPPDGQEDGALDYPAVRLFAERAAAVRPGYLPGAEAGAVVRICRELDGMPLAIELAAARLRSLSAGQIADRLDDRFRLLTGGSRTALPRHQTLRAVVEWSWDLLDGQERALARRLSVFTGGVTLEAAERVCHGAGLERAEVFDVLARLVDKSLLAVVDHDTAARYRMLETIRAYAAERLAESGERDRVRLAHAEFFTGLAEAADPGLRDHRQPVRIAEMSREHDNLSAALRRTTEAGRLDLALRLVGALGWYWWLRGHRVEGAQRAREVLDLVDGEAAAEPLALARAAYGTNAMGAGIELDRALSELTEAIRLAREELTPPWHPMVVITGPVVAVFQGLPRGDSRYLEDMFSHPDPWVAALGHLFHGYEHLTAGRIDVSEKEFATCLAGFRAIGERWGVGNALAALSEVDFVRGEPERGVEKVREAIAVLEEAGSADEVAYMRGRLAVGLNLLGERATAGRLLEESLHDALRGGDRVAAVTLLLARGDFAREGGSLIEAKSHYARALQVVDEEASMPVQVRALTDASLGLLAEQEGDLVRARRLLDAALREALTSSDSWVLGMVLIGLAGLALSEADPARAAVLLGGAATIRGIESVIDFDHVRITERARTALGEQDFRRSYEHGRTLPREEIVSLTG